MCNENAQHIAQRNLWSKTGKFSKQNSKWQNIHGNHCNRCTLIQHVGTDQGLEMNS